MAGGDRGASFRLGPEAFDALAVVEGPIRAGERGLAFLARNSGSRAKFPDSAASMRRLAFSALPRQGTCRRALIRSPDDSGRVTRDGSHEAFQSRPSCSAPHQKRLVTALILRAPVADSGKAAGQVQLRITGPVAEPSTAPQLNTACATGRSLRRHLSRAHGCTHWSGSLAGLASGLGSFGQAPPRSCPA